MVYCIRDEIQKCIIFRDFSQVQPMCYNLQIQETLKMNSYSKHTRPLTVGALLALASFLPLSVSAQQSAASEKPEASVTAAKTPSAPSHCRSGSAQGYLPSSPGAPGCLGPGFEHGTLNGKPRIGEMKLPAPKEPGKGLGIMRAVTPAASTPATAAPTATVTAEEPNKGVEPAKAASKLEDGLQR
jgi:hypothetical protein